MGLIDSGGQIANRITDNWQKKTQNLTENWYL